MRGITTLFSLTISAVAGFFLLHLSDLVPYSGSDAYFRQPAFFPAAMLAATGLIGIGLAAKYAMGLALPEDEELSGTPPHISVLGPLAAIFALYALAVPVLGYLLATLLFGTAALAAGRHLKLAGQIAMIVLGLVLYLVFVAYLDVWFPGGDFPFLAWLS